MTLNFSTHWPGKMKKLSGNRTFFVEKICRCLLDDLIIPEPESAYYIVEYHRLSPFGFENKWERRDKKPILAKRHTIRKDPHNRWTEGNDIHFVICNRTKHRFQFAPVTKCVSVQKIEIKWKSLVEPAIWIDDVLIKDKVKKQLAKNDGFDSVTDFFNWFDEDFEGKIIHWTDLKY